jgi:hypothetical protein
LKIAL